VHLGRLVDHYCIQNIRQLSHTNAHQLSSQAYIVRPYFNTLATFDSKLPKATYKRKTPTELSLNMRHCH
jgi:hypothetical protein